MYLVQSVLICKTSTYSPVGQYHLFWCEFSKCVGIVLEPIINDRLFLTNVTKKKTCEFLRNLKRSSQEIKIDVV